MLALAAEGAAEGLWLRAERQSAGRGRMGRDWQSPVGNHHASTLVRLRPDDPPAPTLALVAAVAVFDTCQSFAPAIPFVLKWPNDVLAGEAKLAGILLERAREAVVIGVGVNLAFHPQGLDRPVTSFAALGVSPPDPAIFGAELASEFARWVAEWRGQGLASIRAAWTERAFPEGTPLLANLGDGESVAGTVAGLDPDGALRLRLADGATRAIHAGDVFVGLRG